MRLRSQLAVVGTVMAMVFCLAAAAAQAADPDAPPGAPPTWLPAVPWVMDHWLPYDETTLFTKLDMSRSTVLQWLAAHGQHAPLADVARARGYSVPRLAQQLVGPRSRGESSALYRELLQRARLTLTQPHLSYHLLGHLYHDWALERALPRVMHYASLRQIVVQHLSGMSFDTIAAWRGVSATSLRGGIGRVLAADQRQGVRSGQTPAAQARFWLSEELTNLPRWLSAVPPPHELSQAAAPGAGTISLLCHLL